jgi:U3 small nucleolar RNA-associated protein 7
MDITRNGRYLLLGGKKGHIALLDWKEKELVTEFHTK